MNRIYGLGNCHVSLRDRSGGDIRFIEIMKRFKGYEKVIITSNIGKSIYQNFGVCAKYLTTTQEKRVSSVIITYLKRAIRTLFLKIRFKEGDIIYSSSDFLPDTLPACVWKLKNKNIKWIQLIHHLIPNPFKREGALINNFISYLAQQVSFFFIKHYCDLVIVVNTLIKKKLAEIGFDVSKIEVNYNGIDTNYFLNVENSTKRYHAVFLGRLHSSKGIFDLIDIWKLVSEKIPNAKLAIIGSGDEKVKEELRKEVKATGLDGNIDILGYLENNKAFRVVKSSKVFVFPSYEEGFGMAILEAMACGLPVVAWNLSVYNYIFKRGLIKIPESDVEKFANTVIKLLKDNAMRKQLSKEAKKQAVSYDWDKIAKREYEVIKKQSFSAPREN